MVQVPAQYRADVAAAARRIGISAAVVAAQIDTESGFDPNVTSPAGAEGIAQFEPGTWAQWGHGSPFNAAAAFLAYGAYMASLVRQYHGNVRNALAAYNAGPGDLAAGYGYADHILAMAGEGVNYTASGGGSSSSTGGAGGATQAQLTSFLTSGSGGVLGDAGALLHGSAVVLDRAFGMFAPGQGWRAAFGLTGIFLLYMAWRAFGGAL